MAFGKRTGLPETELGGGAAPEDPKAQPERPLVFPTRAKGDRRRTPDNIPSAISIRPLIKPDTKVASASDDAPANMAKASPVLVDRRAAASKSKSAANTILEGTGERRFSEAKVLVFAALIESVDLTELGKLSPEHVREEIGDIVSEIINLRNVVLTAAEQQRLIGEICDDVLGLGPLEPLLARDDIADIMVNGANKIYIEIDGKIEETEILGEDKDGNIVGTHRPTGLRPGFWDRARYFGLEDVLTEALDERNAA